MEPSIDTEVKQGNDAPKKRPTTVIYKKNDLALSPQVIHRILADFAGQKIFENVPFDLQAKIYLAMLEMRPFENDKKADVKRFSSLKKWLKDNPHLIQGQFKIEDVFKSIISMKGAVQKGVIPAIVIDDLKHAAQILKEKSVEFLLNYYEFTEEENPFKEFGHDIDSLEERTATELLDSKKYRGLTRGQLKSALRENPWWGVISLSTDYEMNYPSIIASFGDRIKQLNPAAKNSPYIWKFKAKPSAYR